MRTRDLRLGLAVEAISASGVLGGADVVVDELVIIEVAAEHGVVVIGADAGIRLVVTLRHDVDAAIAQRAVYARKVSIGDVDVLQDDLDLVLSDRARRGRALQKLVDESVDAVIRSIRSFRHRVSLLGS